jgi:murein L,D-transpeptidase YcbB/YkuD
MYPFMSRFAVYLFLLGLIWVTEACKQKPSPPAIVTKDSARPKDISIRGGFSDQQLLRTDSGQISRWMKEFPALAGYTSDIQQFYTYRNHRYAWFDQQGLIEQASHLNNQLDNLSQDGIQTPFPYLSKLDSLVNDPIGNPGDQEKLEVFLTAAYFFYADKVWRGISDQDLNRLAWFLPRKKISLPYILDSIMKDSAAKLFSNRFSTGQYYALKKVLAQYRHLDSTESWSLIRSGAKSYRILDSADAVAEIRKRLWLLGDLTQNSGSRVVDSILQKAVIGFQQRFGMTPDGVIGPRFMNYLNTPLKDYIRKIIVNMERMRWIPTYINVHFLLINIPSFSLYAYDADTIHFRMNVVVGKDVHKTVLFSGDIQYIVFSPYWNVPPSIMKSEILPAISRDPAYLKRNNMEWNGNSIRQKPGPKNSLGLVKFLFPNSYNIYLHDSPAKSLFNESSRAFSHGCIRLAEPAKLAIYLLQDVPAWTPEKINQAMHAGKEKYVTLPSPVPVYIGYFTAYLDNAGKIQFRDDVYKRDQALERLLIQ